MRVASQIGADGNPHTRVLTDEERWRCIIYLDHVRVDNAVLADEEEGLDDDHYCEAQLALAPGSESSCRACKARDEARSAYFASKR